MGLGQNLLKGDVVRRLLKQREPPDTTVQDMIRKLSSCKAVAAGHTALVSIPETRVMKRLPTPFLRRQPPPIGMPKGRGKLAREIGHRAQVFFEMMNLKGPIFLPTHMGQVTLGWR
jgi:hypothetical protein